MICPNQPLVCDAYNPIRIGGRALQVIDLPAGEVRAADVPLLALAVRRENECAFACADQYSYSAHVFLLMIEFRALFYCCSFALFRLAMSSLSIAAWRS